MSYVDVLRGQAEVGRRVAVIGAGGIGFDVSEYLLGEKAMETPADKRVDDIRSFLKVCAVCVAVAATDYTNVPIKCSLLLLEDCPDRKPRRTITCKWIHGFVCFRFCFPACISVLVAL